MKRFVMLTQSLGVVRLTFLIAVTSLWVGLAQANYDEARDGRADLTAALSEAKKSGRLVLVVIGGNWCPACRQLDTAIESSARMQSLLRGQFLLQKINYSARNKNKPAMEMLPFFIGYPAAFLLDGNGKAINVPSIHRFLRSGKVDLEQFGDALESAARAP